MEELLPGPVVDATNNGFPRNETSLAPSKPS